MQTTSGKTKRDPKPKRTAQEKIAYSLAFGLTGTPTIATRKRVLFRFPCRTGFSAGRDGVSILLKSRKKPSAVPHLPISATKFQLADAKSRRRKCLLDRPSGIFR
jgi:hypothetical protein